MKDPLTAGLWAAKTKRERQAAALFFFALAGLGLSGVMAAMAVFALGELTGNTATDTVVLVFVTGSSLLALRKGFYLLGAQVCRFCQAPLKPDQFRCAVCAKAVDAPLDETGR